MIVGIVASLRSRYFASLLVCKYPKDCRAIFNVFIYFSNVLSSKEFENNNTNNSFFDKKLIKKLSNLKLFISYIL